MAKRKRTSKQPPVWTIITDALVAAARYTGPKKCVDCTTMITATLAQTRCTVCQVNVNNPRRTA